MKLFKTIFTLSALLAVVGVQARQMYVGNLNFEDKFRQTGTVKGDSVGAAIFVSAQDLQDKVGAKLTSLTMYHVGATAPKYLRLFVANVLDSVFLFSKEIDASIIKEGWNTINLDNPIELTGDSLYMGYYLIGGGSVSQAFTNSSSVQSYIRRGTKESWTSSRGVAIYGTVEGDNLPGYDVVLTSNINSLDVAVNNPFDIVFCVKNVAAETIKSLEVECDFGNGKKETKTINVDIPYLGFDSIVYDDINFDTMGLNDVTFTILKLNGEDDLTPENNQHTIKFNVLERLVTRKVLLEVFSTENCTACPKGHEILEASIDGRHNEIIEVGHHVGFYTDQWTVPADTIYMNFYYAAIVTTFAPAGVIDRTLWSKADGHENSYQGGDSCIVFSIESADVWNLLNVALAKPAYAWIDLKTEFNETDSTITINTSGKSVTEIGGEPRLTIYITEDNLKTERQAGWNSNIKGPYYQHNVNRYIATNVWGDNVTLNEGFEKEYKVKVDPNWNVDNLNVVAFVHNYSTKPNVKERYTDFNVYNAEKVQVRPHSVDVDDVMDAQVTIITRQDNILEVVGEYESGVVYNVNGQIVATLRGSPTISMENMPSGVYLINITLTDGTKYNAKIVK
jgi:hypothetical protein